jgi:hypothetical protein
MATITSDTYLDSGTARTAGEAMAIGSGAKFTIRTDTRIHANAPASFTGSLSSPTFNDIGGELIIDAQNVRWLAYSGVTSGNVPAIGTSITQSAVSGYLLGVWSSISAAPTAVGAACPASGFIKLREVTGGAYSAGAISGLATGASASGADVPGWIEVVWDDGTNFVVPRVGKIKSRGAWFEIGTTNGSVGQTLTVPSTSSALTNNYCPGVWVETASGSGTYEFWPGLSSAANMWVKSALGFAEGYTDKRGQFVKTFGSGQVIFGETSTMSGTYATVAGQAAAYAGIALSSTYVWAGNTVTVTTGTTAHLFRDGQSVYVDFTSGSGTPDGNYTVTVLDTYNFKFTLTGSGTGGNCTVRPGATITFATHGVNEGEDVYCDFTTGTGVDGTYKVYAVTGTGTYNIEYPHSAALTSGNVTTNHTLRVTATAHGMAIGNEVYLDFTSGGATDGRYIMKAIATNTFDINYPFSAAITTSNVTCRWTIGHVPPTGCKVRIPNIIMAACATGTRATNSVPNGTIGTRPEFNTSTAGAIDLEYIYGINLRSIFAQAFSLRLYHCALQETLDVSETASALDINNVGVGSYSAQDVRAAVFTSNFAGGTVANLYAHRPTLGTTDHAFEVLYCNGQTFSNVSCGIIGYARSTGKACNIAGSQNLTFSGLGVYNGNIDIATSANISISNLDYNDRYVGRTSPTTPYYCVTVSAGCDRITLDGLTFGEGNTIPDCHPYTGIFYSAGATNIKVRNIGTSSTYLQTGVWAPNYAGTGVGFVTGGNNNTVKLQKWFVGALRTSLFTSANSDKNVTVEQVLSSNPWLHSAKAVRTEIIAWLNASIKGLTSGLELTSGQTSVYGTHWLDEFRGNSYGAVVLCMNEPTTETASYYSNVSGTVLFNSSGGVEMRAIGAESIWEMQHFAQGHTAFANITPAMSGGTIGNYTITYQIDTGSGWNGSWKTLNTTNLTGETISATTGFKLKIKIVTASTNSTAITFLRIFTVSTTTAQNAIAYPLDTNTLTVSGVVTGSDVVIYDAGTETVLAQSEDIAGTSYAYVYSGADTVDIGVFKAGYVPYFIRDLSITTTDSSVPVAQVADRAYLA